MDGLAFVPIPIRSLSVRKLPTWVKNQIMRTKEITFFIFLKKKYFGKKTRRHILVKPANKQLKTITVGPSAREPEEQEVLLPLGVSPALHR